MTPDQLREMEKRAKDGDHHDLHVLDLTLRNLAPALIDLWEAAEKVADETLSSEHPELRTALAKLKEQA